MCGRSFAGCRPTPRGSGATTPGTPRSARSGSSTSCTPTRRPAAGPRQGCRTAAIGCLDCKQKVIDAVLAEQAPIRERAAEYESQPDLVRSIIADGCDEARDTARETMEAVRQAMGLAYR